MRAFGGHHFRLVVVDLGVIDGRHCELQNFLALHFQISHRGGGVTRAS